jgi:membrane-associated phospholipid phosphatase
VKNGYKNRRIPMIRFNSGTIILTLLLILQSQTIIGQSFFHLKTSREMILGGSGLVLAGFGQYLNNNITLLTVNDINHLSGEDVNCFDHNAIQKYSPNAARLSDILLVATLALPAGLFMSGNVRDDFSTIGLMYAENLLLVNSVSLITKGSVRRIRPYVYNPDAPLEDKLSKDAVRSFYSGHTTNAFASAVFFSVVYSDYFPDSQWKTPVWIGSLGAASIVGILRYGAGKHFPTDIIAGAVVGSAIGFFIPYIHQQENTDFPVSREYQSKTIAIYLSFGLN